MKKGILANILLINLVLCPISNAKSKVDANLEKLCVENPYLMNNYPPCDYLKKELDNNKEKNVSQDLKNFLALSQLKKAKSEAEQRFLKPPFLSESMQAGYQDKQARDVSYPLKNIYKEYFSNWNILLLPDQMSEEKFLEDHFAKFCSKNEQEAGICKATIDAKIPIDLSASSLLSKNVLTTKIEQEAAGRYIRNLTNPIPVPLLEPKKMFKNVEKKILTKEGKENLSARYRQQTISSLAQDSLFGMMAERIPFQNLDGSAQDPNKQNLSRLNLLEKEANRRFNNPEWYNEMNKMSTEALLRELANIEALRLALEFRNGQQLEQVQALLAAQLGYMAQTIGLAEAGKQAASEIEKEAEE